MGSDRADLATTAAAGSDTADDGDMPLMVDRFVIEDELGAGGMGRVYVAYDPTLDRRVAVKLLRERIGIDVEKAQARMAREARAMARLRHPNVVTVHEVGTYERGVFIVMEYVAGGTLRTWLEREPEPDWQQIVAMYVLAGRGLAAAHDAGLVHRDFKPDNVLVGDDGRVLVGDFGLANADPSDATIAAGSPTLPRLTRAGSVMGTPPYMSPEQHQGKPVDARTDQFAFCAALYEALNGTHPFAGSTDTEIADRAIRNVITPPVRDRGAPPRVHDALLRGLQADPARRFPSMQALLAELSRTRRTPWRWLAAGGAAIAVGAVAVAIAHGRSAPSLAPVGAIAVEPFEITINNRRMYDWEDATGDVMASALADIDGLKVVGPSDLLGPERAGAPSKHDGHEGHDATDMKLMRSTEQRTNAATIVRGAIGERDGRLHAHVELVTGEGAPIQTLELERANATELPRLVDDTIHALAAAVAPDQPIDPRHARVRAQAMYRLGDQQLRAANFQRALPFLEEAVVTDPELFEGWYALGMTRSWVLAPESTVFDALAAARKTAATDTQRALVDGVAHYLRHDLPKARAALESLVAGTQLSQVERRDALYLLGEAYWHDGRHREGVGYFQKAVDIDMTYKLPVPHITEFAAANRDVAMLQQYVGLLATSTSQQHDAVEIAQGHYEALARDGAPMTRFHALLVLGEPVPDELAASQVDADPMMRRVYDIARAYERGEPGAARAPLDAIWRDLAQRSGELPGNVYYELRLLGDVLLAAGATAELYRLVAFLGERSGEHPVRNYQRLSMLAAPLVGNKTWIVRRELTDREARLADAIEAELDGNRARAVDLLAAIVHDPSPYWDYPERLALVRNLRALHRDAEAKALCDDTLHPAIFQLALLPAKRACSSSKM